MKKSWAQRLVLGVAGGVFSLLVAEGLCRVALLSGARISFGRDYYPPVRDHELLPYEIPATLEREAIHPIEEVAAPDPDETDVKLSADFYDMMVPLKPLAQFVGHLWKWTPQLGYIYDVVVTIDKYNRRLSRPPGSVRHSKKHLLLAGCSYTFGEGLPDEQTLSWQINAQQEGVEAYNMAFRGYGTNDVVARFMTGNPAAGITQERGLLVYNFLGFHLPRALGASSIPWIGSAADVEEDSKGDWYLAGSFVQAHPWRMHFHNWFNQLAIVRLFRMELPMRVDEQYDWLARMMVEIERLYRQQTSPQNQLVVVLYPQGMKTTDPRKIREALSRHHIHFIDYTAHELGEFTNGPSQIPHDGHPSAEANRFYSRILLRDLQPLLEKSGI